MINLILIQGDCSKILPKIPDNSIDCVVTSPPYNKHSANRKCGKYDSWRQANIDYGVYKDNLSEPEYQEWQKQVLKECVRVIKDDGSIFYNHKPRLINHKVIFPHEWLSEFIIRQMIIWDRGNSPVIDPIRFMPTVEYVFWITKRRRTPKFNKRAFHYKEVWRINPAHNNPHPAPFPNELVRRCIISATQKGDTVLDLFLGSGTTMLTALHLGRSCIGIELNPRFVEMTKKRLNWGYSLNPDIQFRFITEDEILKLDKLELNGE